MTIRLRPHHLLCMLTFIGEGYSPAFVANFEAVLHRILATKEPVHIVEGPDDICAPLLADPACHCRNASVQNRDHLAAEALTALLKTSIQPGQTLDVSPPTLDLLRKAFATGTIRTACKGCQWHSLCDSIATSNFEGTKLKPGAPS